ncbi:MAG TPA: Ig-like domain-containing protein, partial [Kineosporiaceae bacterium]|nr:Ig-like domain-containing protein [Kineosporiaceae bacterium]
MASTTPYPSSLAGSSASPDRPGGSASPARLASSAPSASPSNPPAEPADAWMAVQTGGVLETATLVPTQRGLDTVARTTSFLLTSLDGRPAVPLAARIIVDPPVKFGVTPFGSVGALLRPAEALAPATRYRFALTRGDGTVEASWTARTAGPLHVTDSVPGDTATGVPLDTGVEITFDQAGVGTADMAAHFSIAPSVKGHFEASGRSVAFVPDQPLRTGTLYTVTVHRGLPLAGTGEAMASDAVIRFETAKRRESEVRVWFRDVLVDASPRERAAMSIDTEVPDGWTPPATVAVTVNRLPGFADALRAYAAIAAAPTWTLVSSRAPVSTAGLPRVIAAVVRIRELDQGTQWIQLPRALPVGWYVLTLRFAGVPVQLVLQVTDTSLYTLVTTTRTAVWVNDLLTRGPAVGATATLAGSRLSGSTDRQGLLTAGTPTPVASGVVTTPLLVVRYHGAPMFRPVAFTGDCGGCGKGESITETAPSRYWTFLTTDRSQYRATDTVNLVGIVRQRVSGGVPDVVRLSVSSQESDYGQDDGDVAAGAATPIVAQTATPDSRGMYTASLRLAALPPGSYVLRAQVGTTKVGETWFDVGTIRKPAYAIALTTSRHAVISGQDLGTTVTTTFFDGTPAAGVAAGITFDNSEGAPVATIATDASGRGSAVVRPVITDDQFSVVELTATPTLPEEADLTAQTDAAVFEGDAFITLDGTASAKSVTIDGALHAVDLSRYEVTGVDLGSVDPRGA